MTFGADILGALPEFRARAEELMTDVIRIGAESDEPELNEETGNYEPVFTLIYEGKGKYKSGNTAAQKVDAQSQFLVSQDDQIHLPLLSSVAVEVGMVAVVVSSETDPALPGTKVRLNGFADGSYRTARRFSVELIE